MGLFDLFTNKTERNAQVALTVVLAEYTFDALTPDQKDKVQDAVKRFMERNGRRYLEVFTLPHHHHWGLFASAMQELGINPILPGERWKMAGNPFAIGEADDDFQEALERASALVEERVEKLGKS